MVYRFSTYAFDDETLELTREGRLVRLEPQPARALAVLVVHAGEVVTRDELREAIWGAETHVDYDRGLAYCIGQVRTALGDSAEQPRFVQTLPKRGFRFLAPVTADGPVAAPPLPAAPRRSRRAGLVAAAVLVGAGVTGLGWWLAVPARVPVVAVFDNETGDAAHDRFVTGLSDLVVTELTNLAPGRVGVVGNAAALRQPRNIRNLAALAAAIEADYVVLGQLQRQDDRLRFIVHFIRLSDGVHLQAQRFVRPASDVLSFEGDVLAETTRLVRGFLLAADAS
jgi:DNA-binding winged helix-turn-helix (wHTH) protein/TolB-like protein